MLQATSPKCKTITCAPGEETCHDAFTYPTKPGVVFACSSNSSLVLTVCLDDPGAVSTALLTAVSTSYGQSTLESQYQENTLYTNSPSVCGSTSNRDAEQAVAISTSSSTPIPTDLSHCSKNSPCYGDMTFFEAGLGSCGLTSDGSRDNVVALSSLMMGPQSKSNPYCGKTITISCLATQKTTIATVVDKCMGCDPYSIDLSEKAFRELDELQVGRTDASWYFN